MGGRQYALYNNAYSPLVAPTTYSNPGGTGSTANVALNYAGLAGQELIFQIKLTDVLGIDNFRFSQVPEPSGIALAAVVGIGAGLLQWQRRRKHRLAKADAMAAAEPTLESV